MSRPPSHDSAEAAQGGAARVEPGPDAGIGTGMRTVLTDPPARTALMPPAESPEFDAWLRLHLDRLHASVLTEPVPERFLRLLQGQPN